MKTIFAFILIVICCIHPFYAQKNDRKVKTHKIWITLMDGNKQKGILFSANEDELLISEIKSPTKPVYIVKVNTIKTIEVRRKGKVGRGALIGGASGAVLGGALGYARGDTESFFFSQKEDKAGFYAVTFGVLGTGVGAIYGATKEEFIIFRSIDNYRRHLPKLKRYSISSNSLD